MGVGEGGGSRKVGKVRLRFDKNIVKPVYKTPVWFDSLVYPINVANRFVFLTVNGAPAFLYRYNQ